MSIQSGVNRIVDISAMRTASCSNARYQVRKQLPVADAGLSGLAGDVCWGSEGVQSGASEWPYYSQPFPAASQHRFSSRYGTMYSDQLWQACDSGGQLV